MIWFDHHHRFELNIDKSNTLTQQYKFAYIFFYEPSHLWFALRRDTIDLCHFQRQTTSGLASNLSSLSFSLSPSRSLALSCSFLSFKDESMAILWLYYCHFMHILREKKNKTILCFSLLFRTYVSIYMALFSSLSLHRSLCVWVLNDKNINNIILITHLF